MAHPTDSLVRLQESDTVLDRGSPRLDYPIIPHNQVRRIWRLSVFESDSPDFLDTGDPDLFFGLPGSRDGVWGVELVCDTSLLVRGVSSRTLMSWHFLQEFTPMSTALPVRKELPVREDWGYIRPGAGSESPFHDRPVTGSHLFGSAVCRVLGLWKPRLLLGLRPWTLVGDLRLSCAPCWWCTMPSGTDLPAVDQAGAASAAGNPLPGTFRGFDLNLQSDRLYDLDSAIPDVIGLRAIQPDAAVIKVMSIPDNRCIRVVIPDDHVPNEFHEILIHDMEEEEPPFVALSDLGCLPLDWPRALFTSNPTQAIGRLRAINNA